MENRLARISFIVLCIAWLCWLGGINIRALVGFNLLLPGTLDFKPNIHPYIERTVYGLLAQSSSVINISYIVVWMTGVIFLKTTSLRLKENGWLMICVILFYMFTPVEIYTMVLDLKMWYLDHVGSNDLVEFRKLFIHRLAALAGVPMIALLCYYSAIVFAVIRPLRRNHQLSN